MATSAEILSRIRQPKTGGQVTSADILARIRVKPVSQIDSIQPLPAAPDSGWASISTPATPLSVGSLVEQQPNAAQSTSVDVEPMLLQGTGVGNLRKLDAMALRQQLAPNVMVDLGQPNSPVPPDVTAQDQFIGYPKPETKYIEPLVSGVMSGATLGLSNALPQYQQRPGESETARHVGEFVGAVAPFAKASQLAGVGIKAAFPGLAAATSLDAKLGLVALREGLAGGATAAAMEGVGATQGREFSPENVVLGTVAGAGLGAAFELGGMGIAALRNKPTAQAATPERHEFSSGGRPPIDIPPVAAPTRREPPFVRPVAAPIGKEGFSIEPNILPESPSPQQTVDYLERKRSDLLYEAQVEPDIIRRAEIGRQMRRIDNEAEPYRKSIREQLDALNKKGHTNEDYRGEHQAPDHESGSPLHDLVTRGTYPADVYSSDAARFYGSGDDAGRDAQLFALASSYKNRPNSSITIYRAVPRSLDKPKISQGDWVTIDRRYAMEHGRASLRNDFKIIQKTVHARDIFTEGDSIYEWGYSPQPKVHSKREIERLARKSAAPTERMDLPNQPITKPPIAPEPVAPQKGGELPVQNESVVRSERTTAPDQSVAPNKMVEKQPWEMTQVEHGAMIRENYISGIPKRIADIESKISSGVKKTPKQSIMGGQPTYVEEKLTNADIDAFKKDIEYQNKILDPNSPVSKANDVEYFQLQYKRFHKEAVEQALSEGKPVPPEVLADYPDLKPVSRETPLAKRRIVQRFDDIEHQDATTDLPQGIYANPSEVKSFHADEARRQSFFEVNPDAKALEFTGYKTGVETGPADMGAGGHAARKLLGDRVYAELRDGSKAEVLAFARDRYPDVDFSRNSLDIQQIIEVIGAQEAKRQGYDLISMRSPYRASGVEHMADDEVVLLTERAGTKIPSTGKSSTSPLSPVTQGTRGITTIIDPQVASGSRPVAREDVVNFWERSLNLPIRKGRAFLNQRKAAGLYKPDAEVIRLKEYGALDTISHELGHHFENKVMGGAKKWLRDVPKEAQKELHALGKALYGDRRPQQLGAYKSEGVAEFMMKYLTGQNVRAIAPNFSDFFDATMKANPKLAYTFEQGKQLTTRWYQQGSDARLEAFIKGVGKGPNLIDEVANTVRAPGYIPKVIAQIQNATTNREAVLNLFEKDARKLARITADNTRPTQSPSIMARALAYTAPSKARAWVETAVTDFNGRIKYKGLKAVLDPVKDNLEDFQKYVVAKRAVDLNARGINSGLSTEDAQFAIAKYSSPEFDTAVKEITEWQNATLDYLIEAGGLTEDAAKTIRELNPVYVPFTRAMDATDALPGAGGKRLGDLPKGVKTIRGSNRKIENPLESMIAQTSRMIELSHKIRIGKSIVDLATKSQGMGRWVERVQPPGAMTESTVGALKTALEKAGVNLDEADMDAVLSIYHQNYRPGGKDNIVSFIENGKPSYFQVDPLLYETIQGTAVPQVNNVLMRILSAPARTLRAATTGLNPEFSLITNPLRDAMTLWAQTSNTPGLVRESIRSLSSRTAVAGNKFRYAQSGVDMANSVGLDRNQIQKTISAVMADNVAAKSLNILRHPIETMRNALSITESLPRRMEFNQAYAFYSKKYGEGADALLAATLAAKDVTVDFTRGGTWSMFINQLVPFFNASIQGTSKFGRTLAANPVSSGTKALASITIPSLALWSVNKDKAWYNDPIKNPPWLKYGFWQIEVGQYENGDPIILRIPRPFDWGIAFASVPEAVMEYVSRDNPEAVKEVMGQWFENVNPIKMENLPTFAKAPIEIAANHDFYRDRDVVPEYMANTPADQQFRQSTPQTYKDMARMLGYTSAEVSPLTLQHLTEGYFGGLPTRLMRFAEGSQGQPKQLADYPVVGRLVTRNIESDDYLKSLDFATGQVESRIRELLKFNRIAEADYLRERFSRQYTDGHLRTNEELLKSIADSKKTTEKKKAKFESRVKAYEGARP